MMEKISNWIPWQIREVVHFLLNRRKGCALVKTRGAILRSEGLVISFGGVLDDGRPVHGGAVKLLALRDSLPCNEREFSVLYAVSSSIPHSAEALFKVCRERGIKIVWNQNGVGYPAWAGRESERFNRPMRRLRAMSDFVIYQSQFCKESADRFLGACATPSEILFNPVDTVRFSPRVLPRDIGPLRLLAAGTHGTRDRVLNVLEAVALVRGSGFEVTLTVAGSFQWKNAEIDFERQLNRLALTSYVKRLQNFSQSEAPAMYQAHDVLVHPKYMDPCPTVVLEAMACGLPVIGSASGGMPEIVPANCGVLIPAPKDWDVLNTPTPAELAEAIHRLASQVTDCSQHARSNAVARFSMQPWVEAHRKIMEQCLQ